MRKLQASDNVVYRTLQVPKNSGIFPTFYFSGKVTTLLICYIAWREYPDLQWRHPNFG